ncbi:hypothetical protein E4U41_003513 [Claviceps citrina]|nr:hypothetical protein E4U41_003513 [Claviceps citrina]
MFVYGVAMGACAMATFCVVVYGAGGGSIGADCNTAYSAGCDTVFRARAATFAELTWLILVSAWEIKSLRRSLFCLDPPGAADAERDEQEQEEQEQHGGGSSGSSSSNHHPYRDLYANRFLFWSVVIGALSVFPVVYIPVLNTSFFKHKAITWEWALAVAFTAIYVAAIEAWKLLKRRLRLLEDRPAIEQQQPLRRGGAWAQGGADDDD